MIITITLFLRQAQLQGSTFKVEIYFFAASGCISIFSCSYRWPFVKVKFLNMDAKSPFLKGFFNWWCSKEHFTLSSPTLCLTLYDQCSHHIETSQLIWSANQLTGFYMMRTLVVKGLIRHWASARIYGASFLFVLNIINKIPRIIP